MSMSMLTPNVCTLSNRRVASNTHCFVATNPVPADCSTVSIPTIGRSMPNGPSAWRAFALHLAPASRAHKLPEAAVRDQQVGVESTHWQPDARRGSLPGQWTKPLAR
jgi:hypothetical protein